MRFKKIDLLLVFLILAISFFGVKALFHPGFYTSHDGEHQIIRLNHFILGLRGGQLPVRWAGPPAFNGFGYPLFIFTYRLPFYLGTLFKSISFSLVDSVKAVFILTYILSGILMYFVQKKLWGNNLAALAGAIFYLWAPWRFSIILVRASLGEAVCFLFFPLIIWSVLNSSPFLGAFSLACLLLSHAMLTFLFLPFLLVLMGFCLWQSKKRRKLLYQYLKLLILSIGLSAFYWLPALFEKRYTMFADIIRGFYDQHFPTLKQLIYSPWGYGFSFPGVELDAMSFQVGIAQWTTIFLAIFILFWQWLRKKKLDFNRRLISFLIALFLVTIFLMTSPSSSYWQFLSSFLNLDFPFRYLALTTLFSSLVAGGLMVELKKDKLFKLFLYPAVFGLLFLVFYGNRNHLKVNQYTSFSDSYYQKHPSTSNSFDEYRPRWVTPEYLPQRKEAMVTETGEAKIETQEVRSNRQKFQVEAKKKSLLRLNTIYYPGWRLFVDGEEKEIEIAPSTGLVQFSLPAGNHEVMFKFGRTWDRMIGEIISLFSLAFIAYQLRRPWKRRK